MAVLADYIEDWWTPRKWRPAGGLKYHLTLLNMFVVLRCTLLKVADKLPKLIYSSNKIFAIISDHLLWDTSYAGKTSNCVKEGMDVQSLSRLKMNGSCLEAGEKTQVSLRLFDTSSLHGLKGFRIINSTLIKRTKGKPWPYWWKRCHHMSCKLRFCFPLSGTWWGSHLQHDWPSHGSTSQTTLSRDDPLEE